METQPQATVFNDLAAEIEIPREGTLSRVMLNNQCARVVIFGFSPGQELTEHTSARPAIIQIVRGQARLTLGEARYDAGPGFWTFMPAQLPHSLVAHSEVVMVLTLLRAE